MWRNHIFSRPSFKLTVQAYSWTTVDSQREFFKYSVWGEFKVRQFKRENAFQHFFSMTLFFFLADYIYWHYKRIRILPVAPCEPVESAGAAGPTGSNITKKNTKFSHNNWYHYRRHHRHHNKVIIIITTVIMISQAPLKSAAAAGWPTNTINIH